MVLKALHGFLWLVGSTSLAAAAVVASGFQNPMAVVCDGTHLYVLDEGNGSIRKVNLSTGNQTTFHLEILRSMDIALDGNGDLVVPDRARSELRVLTTAGSPVRRLQLDADPDRKPLIQRLAKAPDGTLSVAIHDETGTRVRRFNANYELLSSFSVAGSCSSNPIASLLIDMGFDSFGNLWVADLFGCGSQYRLRKYAPDGTLLGAWEREAGVPQDNTSQGPDTYSSDGALADIVVHGENVYVVLGFKADATGPLDVDVWSTSGQWLRRSHLAGPTGVAGRGIIQGTEFFFVDTWGTKAVHKVDLSTL